jgi:hypothetical protein
MSVFKLLCLASFLMKMRNYSYYIRRMLTVFNVYYTPVKAGEMMHQGGPIYVAFWPRRVIERKSHYALHPPFIATDRHRISESEG